jgi:histone-lysine N-methyltransferase SETMAR
MALAFFDSKGLIYTNYMPRGTIVNAKYIVEALSNFMKIFKKKRPIMAAADWFLHWDNAPVHTAAIVTDWLASRRFQLLEHLPYLPDLAPSDYFLFPKVKKELAGLTLTRETFKKEREGTVRTPTAADFAKAFRQWYLHCKKCIAIGGSYVRQKT